MLFQFLKNNALFRRVLYSILYARAHVFVKRIQPYLDPRNKILDIGSGTCNVAEVILKKGYNELTLLDVADRSFVPQLKAVIYDGRHMPFDNDHFDVALMLTILHHTESPESIIEEALRVSSRLVIIEDIYDNVFHKYVTFFFDSLLNLEFFGHPHTNKSDQSWRQTFENMGLKVVDAKYQYSHIFFKHVTYHLEKVADVEYSRFEPELVAAV